MKRFRTRTLRAATSLFALAAVSAPAFAQDTAAEEEQGVGDIVVTAQRTSQKLNDVPLSITAATGDQLDNAGIRQMSDLQLTTPGFVPSNSSGYNQMFIRGIGNAIFVGADPSVATFIDDVPRVFGTLVNNFVDVERVEVIKGAPGALYGRNATGGAVNIITRQPIDRRDQGPRAHFVRHQVDVPGLGFPQRAAGRQGRRDRRRRAAQPCRLHQEHHARCQCLYGGNVPGEQCWWTWHRLRSSAPPRRPAAFFNRGLIAKKAHDDEDFWAVSGKLLFRPSDMFKVTFAGDYSKKDDDNGNSGYNHDAGLCRSVFVLPGFLVPSPAPLPTLAGAEPLIVPVTEKFTTAQRSAGLRQAEGLGRFGHRGARTARRRSHLDHLVPQERERVPHRTRLRRPSPCCRRMSPLKKKTFYQELRAVSTGDGPLHWIAGACYLRAQFDGGLFTNIVRAACSKSPSGNGGYVVKNWSAYAQFTYDLSDQAQPHGLGPLYRRKEQRPLVQPAHQQFEQRSR